MQCKTTSIRIHNNFWENMIARFTNDVYRWGNMRNIRIFGNKSHEMRVLVVVLLSLEVDG